MCYLGGYVWMMYLTNFKKLSLLCCFYTTVQRKSVTSFFRFKFLGFQPFIPLPQMKPGPKITSLTKKWTKLERWGCFRPVEISSNAPAGRCKLRAGLNVARFPYPPYQINRMHQAKTTWRNIWNGLDVVILAFSLGTKLGWNLPTF